MGNEELLKKRNHLKEVLKRVITELGYMISKGGGGGWVLDNKTQDKHHRG